MSHHENTGQSYNLLITDKFFEKLAKFKYLGTRITDQNCIHQEIKIRLNLGNAYYRSVQSLLSSRILCRNLETEIYNTIILPVALYGCELDL
jgi:hypothetical protein